MNQNDTLTIGGKEFHSRFILGSGKYSLNLIEAAVKDAGAEIITLAVRRANTKKEEKGIPDSPMRVLQAHYSRTFHRALRKFFPCLFQYGGKCVPKINRPT